MPTPRSSMPAPRSSSSRSTSGHRERKQRTTLSQRLIRAGLTFIVFGLFASLLPENGVAMAVDLGCSPSSPVFYRLTNDIAGGMDTVNGTEQPGYDTPLNFYVFQSLTGESGPYAPFTPSSWSAADPGYSGVPAGSAFNGHTHTVGTSAPGTIIATVPAGDLIIQFKVVNQGIPAYRLTNDSMGGPMTLPGAPLPNGVALQFYVFESSGGSYVPSSSSVMWINGGAYSPATGPTGPYTYEFDGKTNNGTPPAIEPATITAMVGGHALTYNFEVEP